MGKLILTQRGGRYTPNKVGSAKNKEKWGIYALFWFFAADLSAGAFFAGAAALLFFLDVVITSFLVVVVLYCHILLVLFMPGYTLSSRKGNPGKI